MVWARFIYSGMNKLAIIHDTSKSEKSVCNYFKRKSV